MVAFDIASVLQDILLSFGDTCAARAPLGDIQRSRFWICNSLP